MNGWDFASFSSSQESRISQSRPIWAQQLQKLLRAYSAAPTRVPCFSPPHKQLVKQQSAGPLCTALIWCKPGADLYTPAQTSLPVDHQTGISSVLSSALGNCFHFSLARGKWCIYFKEHRRAVGRVGAGGSCHSRRPLQTGWPGGSMATQPAHFVWKKWHAWHLLHARHICDLADIDRAPPSTLQRPVKLQLGLALFTAVCVSVVFMCYTHTERHT